MSKPDRKAEQRYARQGRGQLTLVEHSLCPLDVRRSLVENLVHETSYRFADDSRRSRKVTATVFSPAGLSAHDEFFLWGLLALTLGQKEPDPEFIATPHYCLRQLGVIDQHSSRGGQQYDHFAQAVERLSLVRYRSDHFYDPVRAERRKVGFGFFSYSIPLDVASSRAWRFSWDRVFFDIVKAAGGSLRFDLDLYRQLDPASRRLFLLLCKLFFRRSTTPRFRLRELAVEVLGFADSLDTRDLKQKVKRCLTRLTEIGVIEAGSEFEKHAPGEYSLVLQRGCYFQERRLASSARGSIESPCAEPLRELGFEQRMIDSILGRYPQAMLREWIDITLAAKERFGDSFFRKNPRAYLLDNLKHAGEGNRTPPDWWHELRQAEAGRRALSSKAGKPTRVLTEIATESSDALDQVRRDIFQQFVAGGQSEVIARLNSEKFAEEWKRRRAAGDGSPSAA